MRPMVENEATVADFTKITTASGLLRNWNLVDFFGTGTGMRGLDRKVPPRVRVLRASLEFSLEGWQR